MRLTDAAALGAVFLAMIILGQGNVAAAHDVSVHTQESASSLNSPALHTGSDTSVKPLGSPGNWVGSDDYPPQALRLGMQGVVGFRLDVNESGHVEGCAVTQSSQFSLLDQAVCDLMMKRATFHPVYNREGKPEKGSFSSKFVWKIPAPKSNVRQDTGRRLVLSIDAQGEVKECSVARQIGAGVNTACPSMIFPADVGKILRDGGTEPLRTAYLDDYLLFDPHQLEVFRQPASNEAMIGYLQWRFSIAPDGKVISCQIEHQTGPSRLIQNRCPAIFDRIFVPATPSGGAPAPDHGWILLRYSYKTGP